MEMRYSPTLHTSENLREQLGELHRHNPDIRILGSLGRSVLFRQSFGNAYAEYWARNQSPLYNCPLQARDIDALNVAKPEPGEPFTVDALAFANPEVRVAQEGSDWWLVSDQKDFAEQLHTDVMQPVSGLGVYGIEMSTVPVQTHIAVTHARGVLRPKDETSLRLLHEIGEGGSLYLPDELYEPFERLDAVPVKFALRTAMGGLYRKWTPEYAKPWIDPVLKRARIIDSSN